MFNRWHPEDEEMNIARKRYEQYVRESGNLFSPHWDELGEESQLHWRDVSKNKT